MLDFFLLSRVAIYTPGVIYSFFFLSILVFYRRRGELGATYPRRLYFLGVCLVVFRVLFASFLTAVQYLIWSGERFGSILIKLPLQKGQSFGALDSQLNYFSFYAFEHYWLSLIFSLLLSCAFFLFLRLLQVYRERFFDVGEVELGSLLALLVGWPNGLVFIGVSLVVVIVFSAYRLIRQKGNLTTLGLPFLISGGFVLLFGAYLVASTGLSVFSV